VAENLNDEMETEFSNQEHQEKFKSEMKKLGILQKLRQEN